MIHAYCAVSYVASVVLLLALPSRLGRINNIGGSLVAAALGPVLWPFFLAAVIKNRRRQAA
jgi:hypothetical protein